jgi:hypothetical protein
MEVRIRYILKLSLFYKLRIVNIIKNIFGLCYYLSYKKLKRI